MKDQQCVKVPMRWIHGRFQTDLQMFTLTCKTGIHFSDIIAIYYNFTSILHLPFSPLTTDSTLKVWLRNQMYLSLLLLMIHHLLL